MALDIQLPVSQPSIALTTVVTSGKSLYRVILSEKEESNSSRSPSCCEDKTRLYRRVSFYCASLYYALQILRFLEIEGW